MPKIETFETGTRAFSPSSEGSAAFEMEGRHTEAAFAQAGNAIGGGLATVGHDVQEHQEIQDSSAISAAGAKAFADLTQSLSSTMSSTDPNNADEAGQKWRESADTIIGNVGADAQTTHGQEMAARTQATLRQEFTRQSLAYQSTLGGQAVVQNLEATKNGLAQAVSNNPSTLPTALSMLNGTMEDQLKAHKSLGAGEVATIRSEAGVKAAKDLGIAAFQTMAQRNPDAAKDALGGGVFAGMFSGEEIGTLNRYADAQSRAQKEASTAADREKREADKQDFQTQSAQLFGSFIQPDGSLRVPPDAPQKIVALALHPGAVPGEIHSMEDAIKTINKGGDAISDPATYQMFTSKMVSGNLDDREVFQAVADKQLSQKDASYLLHGEKTLSADPAKKDAMKQFNQWVTAQKPAFTKAGLLGISDPQGAARYNQFMQDAQTKFEQAYDSKGDWKGLLNATNADYLGKGAAHFMQNTKGATVAPPHFTTDADADKGIAGLAKGAPFIGPDGQMHYKN